MYCRFCHNKLTNEFIDLGTTPPSNAFLTKDQLNEPEMFYPLKLMVCEKCWLVQIDEYKKAETIFNQDYPYFSSYSTTWLDHAEQYVNMIIPRLGLDDRSNVMEIGANDGYLLQFFQKKRIPCLGIEPCGNASRAAREKGIPTLEEFFSTSLAEKLARLNEKKELIIGNNVLAHVPDITDFVSGLKTALNSGGVITMEFPHLMCLVEGKQFDTIYHEHFSYLSFYTVNQIFAKHGLTLFDVETLPTHGGSLRIFACHDSDKSKPMSSNVPALLKKEASKGMLDLSFYRHFHEKANRIKNDLLSFLLAQHAKGNKVAAYGAAAKGNTLLNYCGIKKDLIQFVVDASPHKQGRFLPGSHIPIFSEKELKRAKPDYVLILPWNIQDEIMEQLNYISTWGGDFALAVPHLKTTSHGGHLK